MAAVTFPVQISALWFATTRSWVAELVLVHMVVADAGWSASSKKFKGKEVHTANSAVPLALWSSHCWSLLHLHRTYSHRRGHTEVFPSDVLVDNLCSTRVLSETGRPLWFIHSSSGDYFRTQVTGNNVLYSSSRNRTRQSTSSRGTGVMTSCSCCAFSASLPLKENLNRPSVEGVAFAESNQTTVYLCLQNLPM